MATTAGMSGAEAKRTVLARHPRAIVKAELVRLARWDVNAMGVPLLRHESYQGYALYLRDGGVKTPQGHGRTEDEAWIDFLS